MGTVLVILPGWGIFQWLSFLLEGRDWMGFSSYFSVNVFNNEAISK